MAFPEVYNEAYVIGLLEEIKEQLSEAGPESITLRLKDGVRNLLELTAQPAPAPPPAPAPGPKGVLKKPSESKAASERAMERANVTADCCVCGNDAPGQWCKQGFKCNECRTGAHYHEHEVGAPERHVNLSPTISNKPLTSAAERYVVTHNHPRGFAECITPTNDIYNRPVGEPLSAFFYALLRTLPPNIPTVKYTTMTFPLLEDAVEVIPKYRRLFHPNLAYAYAVAADWKRKRLRILIESSVPILYQVATHYSPGKGNEHMFFRQTTEDLRDEVMRTPTPEPQRGLTSQSLRAMDDDFMAKKPFGSFQVTEANDSTSPDNNSSSAWGFQQNDLRKAVSWAGSLATTVAGTESSMAVSAAQRGALPSFYFSSCNAIVEYELFKKIAVSLLQALKFLHEKGFLHGDVRPHNVLFDDNRNTKLIYALFPLDPLPAPFCPPEAESLRADLEAGRVKELTRYNSRGDNLKSSEFGVDNTPPMSLVRHSKATPAWDMYALGVTLQFIAYGGPHHIPHVVQRNTDDEKLIALLDGFLESDPAKRLTIAGALDHPYLSSVRLVNGLPCESVVARVVGEGSSDTQSAMFSLLKRSSGEEGAPSKGASLLGDFLREHGPDFQIVKPHPFSVTLYSVKSDPRRRRSESIAVSGSGSAGLAPPANNNNRRRSVTLPPTHPSQRSDQD
jgi:hypothetical protein